MNSINNTHNNTRVNFQQVWPTPTYNSLSIKKIIQQYQLKIQVIKLPQKSLDYLLSICQNKNFSVSTFQMTLSLTAKFYKKSNSNSPLQLILLCSLFIITKVTQRKQFSINDLHKVSNHCFTNNQIYQCQSLILNLIDFKIHQDGDPSKFIDLLLQMIFQITPNQWFTQIKDLLNDLQKLIWVKIYKGQFKIINQIDIKHFCASLIHLVLIINTKNNGRFPQTVWICKILKIQQNKMDILTEDLLKLVLGKDIVNQYIL